jgi:hypothetical protein
VSSSLATDLVIELAKVKLDAVYVRARRAGLAKLASKIATDLLDDVRLAATEELARRGVHVITYRPPRSRRIT